MIANAALVVLLAVRAGATPVDMRIITPVSSPIAPAARPASDSAYFPGNEIMAARTVLNDLLQIAEVLQSEARNLEADTSELWAQWRALMPAPQMGAPPAEEMRRGEVFGVMNAGRLQNANAHRLIERLSKAERQWWGLWRLLDAEATARRDGSIARPQLDTFKARLETLAGESNALDGGIRQVQGQYDFVRPMMLEHLARVVPTSPALRPAWHWNYALNNNPRPDMSYDYVSKYDDHYTESFEFLRTGATGRR